MKNLNEDCKIGLDNGAKFLIVNRKYYELISQELAKRQKIDSWLVVVDRYKTLIVAVTDEKDFDYRVI